MDSLYSAGKEKAAAGFHGGSGGINIIDEQHCMQMGNQKSLPGIEGKGILHMFTAGLRAVIFLRRSIDDTKKKMRIIREVQCGGQIFCEKFGLIVASLFCLFWCTGTGIMASGCQRSRVWRCFFQQFINEKRRKAAAIFIFKSHHGRAGGVIIEP